MNKFKYLLLFCLFISCKKNKQDTDVITGQWEWFKATGGIGNINQTPQNSGLSWQITFHSNFTSSQTGNLIIAGNGTYTLTEEIYPGGGTRQLLNITSNGITTSFAYSFISNDTLRLDHAVEADGLSYFLVRE